MNADNEHMETEIKIQPFSFYKLYSLTNVTGIENAEKVVDNKLNVDFCNLIAILCQEISILYKLDECVEVITSEAEIQGFLFDLSAFLGELECPYEIITCGALEERFLVSSRRRFLFNFLINEMKTARLYAARQLNNDKKTDDVTFPSYLKLALNTLNVPKPSASVTIPDAVQMIRRSAEKVIQFVSNAPQPLFQPSSMDESKWTHITMLLRNLAQDCRSRNLILLKRMDVTVNSFLWSSRVRKHEDEIRKYYSQQREIYSNVKVPDMSQLLSATDDLLRIEQISSYAKRRGAYHLVKPAVELNPTDRGGRTEDIRGLTNESYSRNQRGIEHGGGKIHGTPRQSYENSVRQEYSNREQDSGTSRGRRGSYRGNRR